MRTYSSSPELRGASLAPDATLGDAVRWAVAQASLAPSELNSQPWLFHVEFSGEPQAARLELLLDESRLLPTIDPTSREAVLACGAVLLNLRLALRAAALGTTVRLAPDPARPELLAQISVSGSALEPDQDRPHHPQVVLRIGYAEPTRPSPRRPLAEVLHLDT